MYLTATNLAHYLLARGQVSAESIVEGDFVVAEAGRRNRNFKVFRKRHPGLFVKQIRSSEPQAMATLWREALCYGIARSEDRYAPLARLMPRLLDYDTTRHALIVDLVDGAENLTEHHQRLRRFPPEIGRLLGSSLGACHSDVGQTFGRRTDLSVFPRQVPWVLSLHQSSEAGLAGLSAANAELVRTLQRYPGFAVHLDRLRAGWRFDSLIHGDMKWDNCLVVQTEDGGTELRIVDWELADVGDAGWDVGAVFQAYLSFWILSMPVVPGVPPERLVATAGWDLDAMRPALREFWRAYSAARGLAGAVAREEKTRCVLYGAARMIQTAYECLAFASRLDGPAVALVQASLNVFQDPEGAAAELLGL
jgi:hypothetical protein